MADLPRDEGRSTLGAQRGALDGVKRRIAVEHDRDIEETLKLISELEAPELEAPITEVLASTTKEMQATENDALIEEVRLEERSRDNP
jgi:hypothetical protein